MYGKWFCIGAGDLALAMLADGILEIAKRVGGVEGAERQRALSHLTLLSGSRRLTGRLRISADPFYKNPFVLDITRNAQAKMLRGQLKTKFGSLPKWVDAPLETALSAKLERWSKKILTVGTFEGALGKRQAVR